MFEINPGHMTEYSEVLRSQENDGELTIKVQQRQLTYFNEFIRLICARDMMAWGIFPNAKEVTESFGAFRAYRKHILTNDSGLKNSDITFVCVGDGSTPRTAITFALRTRGNVCSIDPQLRIDKNWHTRVNNLTCYARHVEDVKIEADNVVIVAVHSHASLDQTLKNIKGRKSRSLIYIPCCKKETVYKNPDLRYDDYGIWSLERHVLIWKQI